MTTSETQEKSARLLERYSYMEGLFANPDFVRWQQDVPETILNDLQERILNIKRDGEWKEELAHLVTSYQAIRDALKSSTEIYEQSLKIARDALKEVEKS